MVSNALPWQGQNSPAGVTVTVHPRWVQTRLKAKYPVPAWTIATRSF
jgi:hypothetical protein